MARNELLAGLAGAKNYPDCPEQTVSEPLFDSAHAALTFAFNYTAQVYDRPLMARLATSPRPHGGKGLAGTDGAAQAGMVLAKLDELPELHQLLILARFMPKTTTCPCCASDVWDADWMAVVRKISDAAMAHGILSGHLVHRSVRDGLVARYFAGKEGRQRILLERLAIRASISERTVVDQNSKITLWLRGSKLTRKGKGAAPEAGVIGEEQLAMNRIEAALLRAETIVGG